MVKISVTPTLFELTSQITNSNIDIYLGSSNALVNVDTFGNLNMNTSVSITQPNYNVYYPGNLGIGTTIPNHRAHIYSDTNLTTYESTSIMLENSSDGELGISFSNALSTNNVFVIGMDSNDTSFRIGYGGQQNQISTTDTLFTIDKNGNVGIGITNPLDKLHLRMFRFPIKNVDGNNTSLGGLYFHDLATNTTKYRVKTDNIYWFSGINNDSETGGIDIYGSNSAIRFVTGDSTYAPTEHMCILGNGNIGIGTTNPQQSIHINKIAGFPTTANVGIGTTNISQILQIQGNTYVLGNVGLGVTNPLYRLHLSRDSAAKPTTSTWTTSSDERLKTNIINANLDQCWDNVQQISLKRYSWCNESYDHSRLGWIAQDVEPYFPKSVETKALYNIPDCKILNTDQLYASMYGALQKAMNKVEIYEKQIADLKERLSKTT